MRLVKAVVFTVICSVVVFGQSNKGGISGTVFDPNGDRVGRVRGYFFQVGDSGRGVRTVPLPLLGQPDPAVIQMLRDAVTAAGNDLAVVEHHAVGEVKGTARSPGPHQRATPDVAAREVAPDQIGILVVVRDRSITPIARNRAKSSSVVVEHRSTSPSWVASCSRRKAYADRRFQGGFRELGRGKRREAGINPESERAAAEREEEDGSTAAHRCISDRFPSISRFG